MSRNIRNNNEAGTSNNTNEVTTDNNTRHITWKL